MHIAGIQLLFAHPENHLEIWLVILFLSKKKFHAKHIFVLTGFMKLGPGPNFMKPVSTQTYLAQKHIA